MFLVEIYFVGGWGDDEYFRKFIGPFETRDAAIAWLLEGKWMMFGAFPRYEFEDLIRSNKAGYLATWEGRWFEDMIELPKIPVKESDMWWKTKIRRVNEYDKRKPATGEIELATIIEIKPPT